MARQKKSSPDTLALRQAVDKYIASPSSKTFNYKQVSTAIGVENPTHHRAVALYLAELAFDGDLIEVAPGKYKTPEHNVTATGTFVRLRNGKNSVITDGDEQAIFVAERNSMHALNGDRVLVTIAARIKGREPEAIVTEIIEKKDQTFIGTLRVEKSFATLTPDSKYIATDILIPRTKIKGGTTGDKAIVRITEWPDDSTSPRGEVVDVLGKAGENNTEIHAILAEFGLPYKYPQAVEKAADKIGAGITAEEIAKRIDMRDVTTFTIDPKDAKDFDDALSIRRLPNGNWEIGVHIADVTHYVHPDTIIDREAQDRATSVYLVDRVVPMLPEHLSNGICSLRPDEEKLTFSTIFEMDERGKVLNSQIARTVIKSNRRFTYEEAQDVIETGKGDYAEEILALDRLPPACTSRNRKTPTSSSRNSCCWPTAPSPPSSARHRARKSQKPSYTACTTCPTPTSCSTWPPCRKHSATRCARQAPPATSTARSTKCWWTSRAKARKISSRPSPSARWQRPYTQPPTSATTAWASTTTPTSRRPSAAIPT